MKIFRIFLISLVVMCLFDCGHLVKPFHYVKGAEYAAVPLKTFNVWIDKDFTERDQLALDDAIAQWNYALNGRIKIVVVSTKFDMDTDVIQKVMNENAGWLIMKIDSKNPLINDGPTLDGQPVERVLAWCNAVGGNRMFVIRDRIPAAWFTGVMLHEMGHLLGAKHTVKYLMQPVYNMEDSRCIDYETLKEVAIAQDIPIGRLNYCQYGSLQKKGNPVVSDKEEGYYTSGFFDD